MDEHPALAAVDCAAVTPSHEELRDQLAELIAIPSVSADAAHAADIERGGSVGRGSHPRSRRHRRRRPVERRTAARDRRGGRRPSVPSRRRRSSATRTSTSSRPTRSSSGSRRRSSSRIATVGSTRAASPTTRGTSSCSSRLLRQLASAGELPVNVRFAFDGEEEIGGQLDRRVGRMQDKGAADAALILDGAMIGRGQPVFYVGVRGMLLLPPARSDRRRRDMHSGMFGAAALNATHALMTALSPALRAPTAGCRSRCGSASRRRPPRSSSAWAQLPPGAEQLAYRGRRADRAGRRRRVLRPHVRRHVARRERDRERLPGSRQDRASGRGAGERLDPPRSRPGPSPRSARRSSGSSARRCRTAPSSRSTLISSGEPAAVEPTSRAIALAGDAFEHVVGARPFLARSAARSRSTRLSSRASRRSRPASARASATCTRRTRTSPRSDRPSGSRPCASVRGSEQLGS